MQAIEEGDEVEVAVGVRRGVGHLEARVSNTRFGGPAPGRLDGRGMVVNPDKLRVRIGLGHENGARAMAAADIRSLTAGTQFIRHAVQGRQPRSEQIRSIPCSEETLRAVEQAGMVLAPLHTLARTEILDGALSNMEQVLNHPVRPRQIHRSVGVCQTQRLLLRQAETA